MNKIIFTAKELTTVPRNPDKLRAFKSGVLWWFRALVTALELKRGTYDIRYESNKGALQNENYTVEVDLETILQPDQGVSYRICGSRTDYVGHEPQWFSPLSKQVIAFPSVLEALTQGVECAPDMLRGEEVLQRS